MEYKINNFNLSDITFKDTKSLSDYFDNGIFQQKIKNLLIGPNVINIKYSNEKTAQMELEENKKIINTVSRLILHNLTVKPEQSFVLQSTSNFSSKSYIKKIFKELDGLISEKLEVDNKQDIFQSILFFDFISLFTCLKDISNDEVSICDFMMRFSFDEGRMKFNIIETLQENNDIIMNKGDSLNNLHIFYLMMYNLSEEELKYYLLCDKTKDYFKIFDKNFEAEDYVKRYVFVNQFALLKNKTQYEEFSKSQNNVVKIKKEYDFYKNLHLSYLSVKDFLGLDEENERKIFEVFFAIILLSEYDIFHDNFADSILEKVKLNKDDLDLYSIIKSMIFSDYKFKLNSKTRDRNSENLHILQKISLNLNISEEKIVFILIMDMHNEKITSNNNSYFKTRNNFVKIIYQLFLDKIKHIFHNFNQNEERNNDNSDNNSLYKFNFLISRSNLVYNQVYTNSLYPVKSSNDIIIVNKSIKDVIISNYIQEMKNYFFLYNSMNITSSIKEYTWPSISYNDNFIQKLLNEQYNYSNILEVFENSTFGLFKILEDPSLISLFKANFNHFIYKKNVIEIIDLKYLKIKHTFGVYYYDLTELVRESTSKKVAQEEDIIYKFLESKPIVKREEHINQTIKQLKKLSNQVVYVNFLIKNGKYKISDVIDDFKLNNIYYFYNNFFNYIINMKDIRENIMKNKKLIQYLPKDDLSLFKNIIAKKIRISNLDFYFENGYIYARNNFNRVLDFNKNIANLIFKYNHKMFYYLTVKKISNSNYSRLKFAINAVRCFVKLTKIYQEKKVFKLIKNLIMDVIIDHYPVSTDVDKISEFRFDFQNESLSKNLPKLHSNLNQFKKIWKNYITDIIYLEMNKSNFLNIINTENIIEERLINFQILLFLFSKKYTFDNFDMLKKNGILHSEFMKSISIEVLSMMGKFINEMKVFLKENEFKLENREIINFDKLLSKRVSITGVNEQQSNNSKMSKSFSMLKLQDNNSVISKKVEPKNFSFKYDYTNSNNADNKTDNIKIESGLDRINDNNNSEYSVNLNFLNEKLKTKPVVIIEKKVMGNKREKIDIETSMGFFKKMSFEDTDEIDNKNNTKSNDMKVEEKEEIKIKVEESPPANKLLLEDLILSSNYSSSNSGDSDGIKIKRLGNYNYSQENEEFNITNNSNISNTNNNNEDVDKIIKVKNANSIPRPVHIPDTYISNDNDKDNDKDKDDNNQYTDSDNTNIYIPFDKINIDDKLNNYYSLSKDNNTPVEYSNSAFYSNKEHKIRKIKSLKVIKPKVIVIEESDNHLQEDNEGDKNDDSILINDTSSVVYLEEKHEKTQVLAICNETDIFISPDSDTEEEYEDKEMLTDLDENRPLANPKKKVIKYIPNDSNKDTLKSQSDYGSVSYLKKNFHSEKLNKQDQYIHLPQLKELDEQLEILLKEMNSLELIAAITESTSKLCFDSDASNDNTYGQENVRKDFYKDIEADLISAKIQLREKI